MTDIDVRSEFQVSKSRSVSPGRPGIIASSNANAGNIIRGLTGNRRRLYRKVVRYFYSLWAANVLLISIEMKTRNDGHRHEWSDSVDSRSEVYC